MIQFNFVSKEQADKLAEVRRKIGSFEKDNFSLAYETYVNSLIAKDKPKDTEVGVLEIIELAKEISLKTGLVIERTHLYLWTDCKKEDKEIQKILKEYNFQWHREKQRWYRADKKRKYFGKSTSWNSIVNKYGQETINK